METLTLRELAIPLIKAIDSFNYLLRSHHRRVAVISYNIGKALDLSEKELSELIIAASLHDIGALSVQERNMLIQEDVTNPTPHCMMGYKMLSTFEVFKDIAKIINYHHIKYKNYLKMDKDEVLFASHIIHLADRIDILINNDDFILNQKKSITKKIEEKTGEIFHPEVFKGFEKASKADIFWIEINNMSIDQLFRKTNFFMDYKLTLKNIEAFALTISRIVDFRSKFTVNHSYTVAHVAAYLGSIFDFSDEDCKKLMIAGYLHDIGKIGLDPAIIEKDGPLSDEEYNFIKLHPYYTGQILNELSTSDWFKDIVLWAERHHEKADGSGYPYSLVAEQMDDGVRILAFADVITALMENRPYRKSLTIEKTFSIVDEKISKEISIEMFDTIKKYQKEINEIVYNCQRHIDGV